MIKFSHSVFALPFALVAMLVAAGGIPAAIVIFWIVMACVAARTAAMCFNRIADRDIDARNPRTAKRELVTGKVNLAFAWQALLVSSLLFFFSAYMLNWTCLILSPFVLGILLVYSYMKRITSLVHWFLGFALACAPLGAWIAITESIAWTPVFLGLGVLFWVAGFDILYSCQDFWIDRKEKGLFSVPKAFGLAKAMTIAQRSHALALLFFFLFWVTADGLGVVTLVMLLIIGLVMLYQHSLVSPRDLSRLDAAFFSANGFISLALLAAVSFDLLMFR